MKSLLELQRDWEGLAQADPLWSICTAPAKRSKGWNQDEFFATGKREIEIVLSCVDALGLKIDWSAPALDFGCGVGRLTRALASRFLECWGIDISSTMIRLAREFNRGYSQCRFLVNDQENLAVLSGNYFAFIYSSIVLQHMANRYSEQYIRELVRVLKPGGVLVFQLPDSLQAGLASRLRTRLGLRARMQRLLRRDTPHAMEMHWMKEKEVCGLIEGCGARLIDVRLTNSTDPAFSGELQYLSAEPNDGYVSKQYCVVKPRGQSECV